MHGAGAQLIAERQRGSGEHHGQHHERQVHNPHYQVDFDQLAGERLAVLGRGLIAGANASLLAAALGFVLSRPEVDVAVMGVTSPRELEEILEAACAPLQPLDWAACALDDARVLTPSLW